ncbi:MAG: porin [Rikenellaceae bacterium]
MTNFKLLFVAFFATLISMSYTSHAQVYPLGESVELFYFTPTESSSVDVVDFIAYTPEQHFLESKAPRFVLTDSKHRFALGIGGVVRGVTSVDFAGIIPTSTDEGFQNAYIPTTLGNLPKAQAQMSAATSEVFVKLVGSAGRLGNFTVYTSMNFMGENYTPQLRKAYVQFCGFTAGQLWSTMTDLNALPPTIDYAGPISYAGYHVPQVRYGRLFARERMQFAIAAEDPTVYATYSTTAVAQAQGVPNFVAYLQANGDGGGHIRVSGIYRNMNYKDLNIDLSDNTSGWGVQLSGVSNLGSVLKLYYQGIYGEGIASYMNDLSNLPYDMVANQNIMGNMQVMPMWGCYGGIQINLSESVYMSTTYSYSRLYGIDSYDMHDVYKHAQYYVANMFWDITNDCTFGVEYIHGNRRDHFGAWGVANRANIMVQYSF